MPKLNHLAFECALAEPWMMLEDDLRLLLAIANREQERRRPGDPGWEPGKHVPQLVGLKDGRDIDGTCDGVIRDGVAILPVMGPIFRRANLFTEMSGATSVELLAKDLQTVMGDPNVRGVVLEIDSPGGTASGIGELASHIHEMRDKKPIVAYVGNQAASAAYYLASACSEIVLASLAQVGSIGAVSPVRLPSETEKKYILEFVSSQSPNKRPDPTTERGKQQYQSMVDSIADVFISDVARYRGVSREAVINDFGQGGMLLGQSAVDADMADRIGTLEGTIAELSKRPKSIVQPGSGMGALTLSQESEASVSWKDLKQVLMGIPDDADPGTVPTLVAASKPVAPVAPVAVEAATIVQQPDPEVVELKRQVAVLMAQHTTMATQLNTSHVAKVEQQAAMFADSLVYSAQIHSAEAGPLASLYQQMARDDFSHPLQAAEGTVVKEAPTRVGMLEALCSARPRHGMFGTGIDPNTGLPAGAKVLASTHPIKADPRDPLAPTDPDRIKALIGMTDMGQAALKSKRSA